ncbi:hypothetical protein Dimus_036595 [Dionaea muscipula]
MDTPHSPHLSVNPTTPPPLSLSAMESLKSATPTIPFKSKKPVHKSTEKSDQTPTKSKPSSDLDFPASKTPEKSDPPRLQMRNQNAALPIGEIRRAALELRKSKLSQSDMETVMGESDLSLDSGIGRLEHENCPSFMPKDSIKLPEKYEMLCEFFNAMVSSIQLLRLKRSSSTFMNISPKVESLTDRRFTVEHLAQLKHILSEAILIKRIHVKDEETSCMKEELHITLDADTLRTNENEKDVSGPSLLKKVFRSRIMEYCETHSVGDEIPEGTMPRLFYLPKQAPDTTISVHNGLSTASHNPSSFRKCLSRRISSTGELCSTNILGRPASCIGEGNTTSIGNPASCPEEPKSLEESTTELPPLHVLATARKEMDYLEVSLSGKGADSTCGTPAKLVSTPARFMATTPSLKPDRCCYMSPDDDSCAPPNKLLQRSNWIKSLKFGPPGDDDILDVKTDQFQGSVTGDGMDFLPKSLLQSVREEEQKIVEEQDPAISQAKRRHQLMDGLPQLFDMIHLLFRSINRTVMTKEEFMYKIIVGHQEIVDRGEALYPSHVTNHGYEYGSIVLEQKNCILCS